MEYARYYKGSLKAIVITGTNEENLIKAKKEIEKLNNECEIIIKSIDVVNSKEMHEMFVEIDREYPLDLVISNAGISQDSIKDSSNEESATKRVIDVNIHGVLNTVFPALSLMKGRNNGGQILIISSTSAFCAPLLGIYGLTKLFEYGFALLQRMKNLKYGIHVSVAIPGWVQTDLSAGYSGYKYFEIDAEECAKSIRIQLAADVPILTFQSIFSAFAFGIGTAVPFAFGMETIWYLLFARPTIKKNLNKEKAN